MRPPDPDRSGAPRGRERLRTAVLGALVVAAMGCAGLPLPLGAPPQYDYFSQPDIDDPWTPKIAGWQRRERADAPQVAGPAAVAGPGSLFAPPAGGERELRGKYAAFRAERRREIAREFADWIQLEAKQHYIPDGPIDHWATLEETLRGNGDDCDGLELLVFQGLRDLGFGDDEVFRAIVYRPDDGQHHMVTLWFEDPSDPWVIDPTGAMTSGLHRMSEIPGWVPLKVFSDAREYSARPVDMRDLAAR